jgi:hypothetical protein
MSRASIATLKRLAEDGREQLVDRRVVVLSTTP